MRTKWFKRGDKWDKVILSDDKERALESSFIKEYIDMFNEIQSKVDSQELDHDQKFLLSLEIFKKLASPGHFKLERFIEEMRDEQMSKN